MGQFVEADTFASLACKSKVRKFSNRCNNAVYHISSFAPGDEPKKSTQNVDSVKKWPKQQGKTINFTGVIRDLNILHDLCNLNPSRTNSSKTDSVPTFLSIFQPIYHKTNLNQVFLVSDGLRKDLHACFSNDDCRACVFNNAPTHNLTEWKDEVDINSIGLVRYYKPMSTNEEVYNKVDIFDVPDEATVQHYNCQTLFKLEDPYKFQMYDVPQSQINSSEKCTVTNNNNLLKNVDWYNHWFQLKAQMKGATSNNVIVPHAESNKESEFGWCHK